MRIGDHQLHATQAPARLAAQELDPERFGLAMASGHPSGAFPTVLPAADQRPPTPQKGGTTFAYRDLKDGYGFFRYFVSR